MSGLLRRLDRLQRSHSWLAFPFGVVKKFGEDRAGSKAALVAYYAFFSIFPLLLVFTTVLGFVLSNNQELQQKILDSTFSQFPIIGDEIKANVGTISANGVALAIGLIGTLWGGLAVTQAAADAMNAVWNVPQRRRPNFARRRLRGLIFLTVMGFTIILTTFLTGFAATGSGAGLQIAAGLVSAVINFGLFLFAFRVLTGEDLSWGDVWPGAALAAVAWGTLQALGSWYVTRVVKGASQVYGLFAIVIGMLSWLFLAAEIILYCAEVNVVLRRHLWPRSLVTPPLNEKDKEALEMLAKMEERRPEQRINVSFDGG